MAFDPHFNSDDIDVEPPSPEVGGGQGKRSLERLIADAPLDRISTKRTVRGLKFANAEVATTRNHRDRWVARFNTFRTHTLGQDIAKPFTFETVIRFFDAIIGKYRHYFASVLPPQAGVR